MVNRHTAELYDYTSQLIGHCHNSKWAVAKAAMEHPEVAFFKAWGTGGMRHISDVRHLMHPKNNTHSFYVPVAGVTPVVNEFDPADIIDN